MELILKKDGALAVVRSLGGELISYKKDGKEYVAVRGGTWFNERAICRPTCRYYIFPNSKHFNNGFRLVKDL